MLHRRQPRPLRLSQSSCTYLRLLRRQLLVYNPSLLGCYRVANHYLLVSKPVRLFPAARGEA